MPAPTPTAPPSPSWLRGSLIPLGLLGAASAIGLIVGQCTRGERPSFLGGEPTPAPTSPRLADEPLVDLALVDPRLILRLRYATADNFTHQQLYPLARALLRRGVAAALARAQDELAGDGLRLLVYDAYRPLSVQRAMWAVLPNPDFVADPAQGSRHNRGAAVDVSLADASGRELDMPSAHDDFSERARRDWPGASAEQRANLARLDRAMRSAGFAGMASEWWHYDAPDWVLYPLLDTPLERAAQDAPNHEPVVPPADPVR